MVVDSLFFSYFFWVLAIILFINRKTFNKGTVKVQEQDGKYLYISDFGSKYVICILCERKDSYDGILLCSEKVPLKLYFGGIEYKYERRDESNSAKFATHTATDHIHARVESFLSIMASADSQLIEKLLASYSSDDRIHIESCYNKCNWKRTSFFRVILSLVSLALGVYLYSNYYPSQG